MEAKHTLRMKEDTFYVWVAGSCDYGHEKRSSAGAYIMMKDSRVYERYVTTDDHTTEFRMILTVMNHAMETLPHGSDIVFLTNVSYIQQNFDKEPTGSSANADLINVCRSLKATHASVEVRLVPFHKYPELPETHELAHEAMKRHRSGGQQERIRIQVEEYYAPRLRANPLDPSQLEEIVAEDYSVFSYCMTEAMIERLGDIAEYIDILEPDYLRKKIKRQ